MEEIKMMLVNLQQDLRQQKQDILEMKEDIKNTINNNINEKFSNIEQKNEFLERKAEEQSVKINILERQIRRKNLVFFGVEESEKSYHELEDMITNIINTHFKVPCDRNNIESARRLGKKNDKVRPIVVSFTTMGFKLNIQKTKNCLDNTSYYIKEDYPLEVLKKRKELQIQLQIEKEAGNIAYIKYDKLIVLNQNNNRQISHNHSNQHNKRNLSESPEMHPSNSQNTQQENKNPSKKNKAANMKNYLIQRPKLVLNQTDTVKKPENGSQTTQQNAI